MAVSMFTLGVRYVDSDLDRLTGQLRESFDRGIEIILEGLSAAR